MKPVLMHCSYHKCLTVYFSHVVGALLNTPLNSHGYKHFNSLIDDFYGEQNQYTIASVNNHLIDLSRYRDYRITRLIRDPRDMIISGYFYHKRGAEPWSEIQSPNDDDWRIVNGYIPEGMRGSNHSYASYLQSLSLEEGLLAEIEWRTHHFRSMASWPMNDDRIRLYRYEDILGNEDSVMRDILEFLELSKLRVWWGSRLAGKNSAANRKGQSSHVRDPSSGQWQKHFTPKVEAHFMALHGDMLKQYGYL